MTLRFPPCLDILKKSPIYTGSVRSYFDLNQGVILATSTSKPIFFYSIVENGKHRYYNITLDVTDLPKIFGLGKTYILGGSNILFESDEFKMFCDELFSETEKSEYYEDVEIEIESHSRRIAILFTFGDTPTLIEYQSESRSLTECLLFEYFTRISKLDYRAKFSYNTSVGFSVRGVDLSLKQFFEKYFWNCLGYFVSYQPSATDEIWNSYYDWGRKVSKLVENLETTKPEFLLFSDAIPLKLDVCRRIFMSLKREKYM